MQVTNAIGPGEILGHVNNEEMDIYTDIFETRDLTIPIQWGEFPQTSSSEIRVRARGEYLGAQNEVVEIFDTGDLYANKKEIQVKRILAPEIDFERPLDCSEDAIEITASNYGSADSFDWTLSDGQISSDNGTSITVIPPLSGNFSVNCTARRSDGNPEYFRTSNVTITRTSRSTQFEVIPDSPNFLCRGESRTFSIEDQEAIINVEWSAQGCSISSETITNGKRQVTITPNSGSRVTISAKVIFEGGCTASTQSRSFKIYKPEIPPKPQGYVYMEPIAGDVCNAQGYRVNFVSSNSYSNGSTTVSPSVLPPHAGTQPRTVTVCYRNPCSGTSTCSTYLASPPSPCAQNIGEDIIVYPNPTTGNISVPVGKSETVYEIYNFDGHMVQKGILKEEENFQVEMNRSLINGQYILQIFIDGNKISKQIILSR